MNRISKFSILASIALASSCNVMDNGWLSEGDYFYLKSKEAVMPVWVMGDTSSKTFLLTNHGGPGTVSGLHFHKNEHFFQRLEEDYAVVYWDQRMSGNSKGDPELKDLTIDQHVEDLEKLVALLKGKYDIESLFIYGHSWGGGLSIAYLGKDDNQSNVKGWIDEDGALQDKLEMDLKREWILPRAQEKLEQTGDKYWQEVLDWWDNNPNPDDRNWEPYQHVDKLGGYIYDVESWEKLNKVSKAETIFFSPLTPLWLGNQYIDGEWVAGYDFIDKAKQITIPSLILWGKEDGAGPVAVSDTLYQLLQTPQEHKYLHQFDECGHSPHEEKPHEAYELVKDFIDKYK